MRRLICPYCGAEAVCVELKDGKRRWKCTTSGCDAFVGAHARSGAPLGTLANRELRLCRQSLHASFDLLWRKYKFGRTDSYQFLAVVLGVPKKKAHIGAMNLDQCFQAAYEVRIALEKFKSSRREGVAYVLGLVKGEKSGDAVSIDQPDQPDV